jgi:hypothetical protein
MGTPWSAQWLTWCWEISLEPCWFVWSTTFRESLVPFLEFVLESRKRLPELGFFFGVDESIHRSSSLSQVAVDWRAGWMWSDLCPGFCVFLLQFSLSDRNMFAVGSYRGLRYKCASKVFIYTAFCVLLHSGQPENSFVFVTNVELYQCNRTNNTHYLLQFYFD